MNPIKQFFAKRKAEKKFEKAGPGHKLADNSTSSQGKRECGHRNQRGEGVQKAGAATIVSQYPRGEGVQRAAAAALARVERTKPTEVNWSLSALRAQARKELSLESQASENAKVGPKEIVTDSAPVLSVSGVYFSSPFTGPAVLPRQEIEAKIKEFLYEQLETERGLTACLIIHTCNKNKEKVRLGVETICRYLTNIIDNPTEEKYRKIRINNKAFQDRVTNLEGAHDLLMATGFKRISLPNGDTEEDFYVFPEEELSNIENVQMLKEALFGTEPIYPTLDRNTRVLMPSQASEKINLPSDFFNITVDEIVKEHEARVEAADLETQLRTKAMRERDSIKELRTYRYSLVRLRLPDGIILQGTFNVRERLSAVKDFVAENAADPNREFQLLAPGGFKLTEYDSTLAELKLVPAVILNLTWSDDDDDNGTHGEETAYLKSETMALLQTL